MHRASPKPLFVRFTTEIGVHGAGQKGDPRRSAKARRSPIADAGSRTQDGLELAAATRPDDAAGTTRAVRNSAGGDLNKKTRTRRRSQILHRFELPSLSQSFI
jgi:hypothetical protein